MRKRHSWNSLGNGSKKRDAPETNPSKSALISCHYHHGSQTVLSSPFRGFLL